VRKVLLVLVSQSMESMLTTLLLLLHTQQACLVMVTLQQMEVYGFGIQKLKTGTTLEI
jgi:hypothetical protein